MIYLYFLIILSIKFITILKMLTLSVEHKKNLQLLTELPINVFQSCCKLVNDFFHKGHNYKVYTTVAHKINIESENLKQYIDGLIHLFIECVKHEINSKNFKEFIISLGFDDKKEELLSKLYTSKQATIKASIADIGFEVLNYHNLEWRFETQVASRSMLSQLEPTITIDLALKKNTDSDVSKHIIVQSDATNIINLSKELEVALQEGRSQHMRKIQRIGKQIQ